MNTIRWYIKNKVILFNITNDLELEDLKVLNKKIVNMLNDVDDAVQIIYRSENVALPQDICRVTQELTFLTHENCDCIITIGSNILMTFAGRIINGSTNLKLKAVANLDEADKLLARMPQNHSLGMSV